MPNIIKTQADERHWEKAKTIVTEQYPDVQENSKQFYKLAMGVFKQMTKTASPDETIQALYNESVISKEAVDFFYENKKLAEVNEIFKEAGLASDTWSSVKNKLPEGIALGLGIAGAAGLVSGGAKGISSLRNKFTRKKRLDEAAKFDPSIREMDPQLVNAAMKDIENLNPDYAKSPLITGSYLKSINMWGGLNVDQANLLKDKDKGKSTLDNFRGGFELVNKDTRPKGEQKKEKQNASVFNNPTVINKLSSEKDASLLNPTSNMGKKVMEGAQTAVGGAAIATGLVGGSMLAKKLLNKFTRGSRIKEMNELYPELKNHDEKSIERALKTVETVNPTFAKDPYISGGYVSEILKNKGIKPKTVEGLAEAAGNLENYRPFSSAKNYLSN